MMNGKRRMQSEARVRSLLHSEFRLLRKLPRESASNSRPTGPARDAEAFVYATSTSFPPPPLSTSLPLPPTRLSSPDPPNRRSFPPPPFNVAGRLIAELILIV